MLKCIFLFDRFKQQKNIGVLRGAIRVPYTIREIYSSCYSINLDSGKNNL